MLKKSLLTVIITCFIISDFLYAQNINYPPSPKGDIVEDYHGTFVPDPYQWLESIDSKKSVAWVEAQNLISEHYLDSLPSRSYFSSRLKELELVNRPRIPQRQWSFWISRERRENGTVYYTIQDSLLGPLKNLLDADRLFPNKEMKINHVRISPNARYLMYSASAPGTREMEAFVRDLRNDEDLSDRIKGLKFNAPYWTADSKGFVYYRYLEIDKEGRDINSAVFYHTIGTSITEDLMLAKSKPEDIGATTWSRISENGRFVFIYDELAGKQKLSVMDLGDPFNPNFDAPLVALNTSRDGNYEIIGTSGDTLYVKTTKSAPNGKVIAIQLDDPENWVTILPESELVLQHVRLFGGHFVAAYRRDVKSVLQIYSLDGKGPVDINLPTMGSVFNLNGHKDDSTFIFCFDSYAYPLTVLQVDLNTNELINGGIQEADHKPTDYVTKQIFFSSKDGTQVPMFITHRQGIKFDGRTPTLLYGYGSGGIEEPIFQDDWFAWMEAGGILAVANVRGGEEYGNEWEMAGRKENKQNTFDDFIAAAERLIEDGYTSPTNLAIYGVSNGGLLIGAAMTQRPDLFAAAIPSVGVLDVLRFKNFTAGPRWAASNGDSSNPDEFVWLYSWSPLHQLKKGVCYPATLVMTASNDDLVHPSQSYKFAARLQDVQECAQPTLLRVYPGGGHDIGYSIETQADLLAFAAYHTGLKVKE